MEGLNMPLSHHQTSPGQKVRSDIADCSNLVNSRQNVVLSTSTPHFAQSILPQYQAALDQRVRTSPRLDQRV